MIGSQNQVLALVFNEAQLGLCMGTPEHEHLGGAVERHLADQAVCNDFPTLSRMRGGLSILDGQHGIQ